MITLYNIGPFYGLPDPSPFCLKVETYMRMAGLEFETSSGAVNLRNAPKGKLPFIKDNGKIIPDSAFIISYLKETYGDKLDAPLDKKQKAIAHAFIKTIDENLYWCIVRSRWMDNNIWPIIKKDFFGKLPFPLKNIICSVARRGVKKSLHLHGIGRHSDEEILEIARRDLYALSDYLNDKPYFFGDKPSTLDAVAYGFLAEIIIPPLETPLKKLAISYANLVAFCDRVRNKYYPV